MSSVTEDQVLAALKAVKDPDLHRDIVSLGFVKNIRISDAAVSFTIELTTPACPVRDALKAEAEEAVGSLPGVAAVSVDMTANVRGRAPSPEQLVPGVKHIIAVASGKGGVGKSSVAVNLAVALAQTGARVGLMDADIYGPSLPLMMGITSRPLLTETDEGPKIVPVAAHGVLVISIGFFLDDDRAVVWRGPMLGKALQQFFVDVTWGELDYLIVDLPPGTGDVPMSLAQMAPLSGVVIVMTPQRVAQEIARKSVLMFRTLEEGTGRPIPILGVIENMSGGVFGAGGAAEAAERLGIPYLGAVPLDASVSEAGDSGAPVTMSRPDSAAAAAFRAVAGSLAARLSVLEYGD
jgi:ATP-binding protein involved in chromosome partitioning